MNKKLDRINRKWHFFLLFQALAKSQNKKENKVKRELTKEWRFFKKNSLSGFFETWPWILLTYYSIQFPDSFLEFSDSI